MMLFSAIDVAVMATFAIFGVFMSRVPAGVVAALLVATAAFILLLDDVKVRLFRRLPID